ncbi:putative membrane protein [Kineococcus xinjiangensis]|uniref:Putative membrane protein n=1 Tax=Kineococcus xinjiangensis TaxID=512762 RepID=A0A2S6IC81_9ACTN|nr:cytochrome c oxidase assembly protein [Kineococcus xinjiangensis]PPK90810.1 putative membrane protein [Kineococcus xinjiangensis]
MGGSAHLHTGGDAVTWLLLAAVSVTALALHRFLVRRRRHRLGRAWSRWRTASFATGVLLAVSAVSPPLARLAHDDLTGHVVQHLLLGMFAPLALVLAAPVTLLLGALRPRAGRRLGAVLGRRGVHVLSHPAVAAVLDVGGLYALHLTPLYALSLREPVLHVLVHAHFLLAGCLFAWAVAGPDPAPRRPGTAVRAGVLVLAVAAHSTLAKLLYAAGGRFPPGAGAGAAEVERAAQWMYYGGDVAELLLAVALFAGWYRRGARTAGRRSGTGRKRTPVRGTPRTGVPA